MRALLIVSSSQYSGGTSRVFVPPFPHLGIAYLASTLQKRNTVVKIVDMSVGYSLNELSNVINDFKFDYHEPIRPLC